MASLVPIEIDAPRPLVDAVLLDDDERVHMTWRMPPFYIDISLGAGKDGCEIARTLEKAGILNIYLATGYLNSDINAPCPVVGKAPPWN